MTLVRVVNEYLPPDILTGHLEPGLTQPVGNVPLVEQQSAESLNVP